MRKTVVINKAHNYLRITDYSEEFVNRVIMPFCRRYLYKYAKKPIPGTRKTQSYVSHVFARMNNDKTEFRISAGLLKEFLSFMEYCGYAPNRAEIREVPEIVPAKVEFEWKKPFGERREHQVEWCDYHLAPGGIKVNNAGTGQGKDQPLDAAIKVPGGWSTMGEMRVGTKVIARDGSITKVNGIYPQGVKKIYRVTFGDGRTAEAGAEHLWKVYDCSLTKNLRTRAYSELTQEEKDGHRWRVYTTAEIIERLKMSQPRLYIPLCESEQNPDIKLPMDPYLLGVILGDGCSLSTTPTITKPYQQLFDKIQSKLPDWMECKWVDERKGCFSLKRKSQSGGDRSNWVNFNLVKMDIMGLRSWEKFIPSEYFNGSTEQRLELLRGLLDTDGTVGKNRAISFSSSSEKLSKGVQYLVRSLGGIAKISTRIPHYTYKGERKEGRLDHRVYIRFPDPNKLFTLDHKKERAQKGQYSDILKLRIVKVEELGECETQCISVDHPEHLYVTDDFIVTHNTYMSTDTMVNMGVRTLITALPRYVPIWSKSLFEYLNLKVEDVVYVESGEIEEVAENIQKGIINPKVIILPLTRIDTHYKRMREDDAVPDLDELYAKMGIGLRIMDEGHESVYQVYMSMLYGNFSKTLALSATLKADDQLINRIYSYIYPYDIRLKEGEQKKYIDVYAYHHWIDIRKFRINPRGFGGYNHVKFEQGIMKSPYLLGRYYELCKQAFEEFYVKDLLPEQKALWFFATVEMCVNMLEFFKRDYPEMDFGKYTNEESSKADTKDNYLKHQVLITTPQSCSTGKDIEKLYVAFSPYAVSSKQRNAQSLGRLREITKWWPDLSPKYVYFVCQNVDKQVDYHRKRMEEFANKAKSITNINSGHSIP